jgi:hypothetical protein
MRANLIRATSLLWVATLAAVVAGGELRAQAADWKLQAYLLWGTDDRQPPAGKNYKTVDLEVRQKLKDLPLKWTNWFEVNRVAFVLPQGGAKEVPISEKCQVNMKRLGHSETEVALIGKGKEVVKRTQALPKGEMLVLGGNAPNATAWLVVLKRFE